MAELRSSIQELQQFIHSNIWYDLSKEMLAWKEDIRDQLETMSELHTVSRLQGNAEAVNRFLELPANLIDLLQVDAKAAEYRRRINE